MSIELVATGLLCDARWLQRLGMNCVGIVLGCAQLLCCSVTAEPDLLDLLLQLLYLCCALIDLCKGLAVGRLAGAESILYQLHLRLQGLTAC